VVEGIPDLLVAEAQDTTNVLTPAVDLTVMVLAWNEAENLRTLLPRIRQVLQRMAISYELVVVDAGSSDGTAQVGAEAGARVARQTEPGYGGALRMGFSVARGRLIATMDGDHQHDPDFLEAMWAAREGAGLVIASRYVEGGRADMPIYRKLFSRILNRIYGFGLGVHFRDMSSGFRLYRRSVINSIAIEGRNFDVLEDILLRVVADGHQVVEVPLHHKARLTGRSHVMLLQFVVSYLRTFWRLRRLRNAPESADYESWSLESFNLPRRWRARRRMAAIVRAVSGSRRALALRVGADPVIAGGADDRADVVLDRGRGALPVGVLHAEAASEIPDREVPEPRELCRERAKRREIEQLGADVGVQALQRQPRNVLHACDRLARIGHREAELRIGLSRRDLLVCLPLHVGRDTHQHLLLGAGAGRLVGKQPLQPVDLVEVVDGDQADAGAQRHSKLRLGLGVSVEHDSPRRESRRQRKVQLAAGGDVTPEALLREQSQHGNTGKCLRREHHMQIRVARVAAGLHELAGAGPQVLFGDDVRRRPELPGELDRVAAADLEPATLVQPATERKHARERRAGGHRG